MPIDDVMNALGGAGQVLVAAVMAVILLIVVLWILVPFTVLGLRGRMTEMRDDQRRVLATLREQQRLEHELLGALIEEQQVTNDILARLGQGEQPQGSAEPAVDPSAAPPPAPAEVAPALDGRATDRGVRPPRPLIADR